MIQYTEIEESAGAGTGVLKYWQMHSPETVAIETHRLFPYGCAELLFPVNGIFSEYDQPPLTNGTVQFLGPLNTPTRVSVGGQVDLFGVRLRAGRAPLLLGTDVTEYVQQVTKPHVIAQLPSIEELLAPKNTTASEDTAGNSEATIEERAEIVRDILATLVRKPTPQEEKLFEAIDTVIEQNGKIALDSVAAIAGISKRGLERKFKQYVGLSPKKFIRIMRLKYVLDRSNTDESQLKRVTSLAMQAGFYDQAHFIKDFRNWIKESPGAFMRKHRSRLTGSFYKANEAEVGSDEPTTKESE